MRPGPWPRWTWRTNIPSSTSRLRTPSDATAAGELLGAQRRLGGEERLEQLAARGRHAQPAGAQGGGRSGGGLGLDGRSQA
jgi:hypothetical protein